MKTLTKEHMINWLVRYYEYRNQMVWMGVNYENTTQCLSAIRGYYESCPESELVEDFRQFNGC